MRVKALLALPLALLLNSCGHTPQTVNPTGESAFSAGLQAKESPMLAELVKEGKLPPVSKRLPVDPLVVKPVERLGTYGGALRMIHDVPDLGILKIMLGYVPLLRWNSSSNGIEPGLAKSYEYSDGGKTLTLHLRKGLRWSDGYPYSSSDFKYWYDLATSGKLKLIPPGCSIVNGKRMTVEAPDPVTIVLKFAGPNYFAHLQLATGFWNPEEYSIPKHFMAKFDPAINHKYKDYVMFEKKNITHMNPDRPTMWPWRLKSIGSSGTRVTFERNPYCYMVDTSGRQLPYIDRVRSTLVTDPQLRVLRMLAGEVDVEFRLIGLTDLTDLNLYMKGQKQGGYHIKLWQEGSGAMSAVCLNWDERDPVLRKLFHDKRFRRALAYVVPREKINLVEYRGMAEAQNSVISAQSWHFATPEGQKLYEQWRHLYSEYDPKKSEALLNDVGLKRDAEGYRLRPDGKRLTLIFTAPAAAAARKENDEAMMVSDEWKKLGIKVIINTPPGPEINNRIILGKYDVAMIGESEMDLFTYPDWVFPTGNRYWHPLTGKWYETGGKQGVKPEGPMKDLLDIFDRIKSEPDLAKCHQLVLDAVRIHISEGPFSLGTVGRSPTPVLVKNDLYNVPDTGVLGPWAVSQPAASYPEQFFFDRSKSQVARNGRSIQ
jgi:peptide/nickel transport system substrate-binding protein